MSEKHLEQPDTEEVAAAIGELTTAVHDLRTDQEVRTHALGLAIQAYCRNGGDLAAAGIVPLAVDFHAFLSAETLGTPGA